MSFLVRQIAKRADGGDIIRTRTVTNPELIVGRGTDCDIQLADLGLMLRHARLIRLPGAFVAVEALGSVPLEIGGKFVTRADLKVTDRPVINLASHRITLEPGEKEGDVLVIAERAIAATDAADAAAETEIFSLSGALPSRRSLAWTLTIAVLVFGLLAPLITFALRDTVSLPDSMLAEAARLTPASTTAASDRRLALPADAPVPLTGQQPDIFWTSGEMSGAHAGITNSCGACHQKAFVATRDEACVACHKPSAVPDHAAPDRMARGMVQPTGLAGTIKAGIHNAVGLEPGRCASCHKEHEGPNGALMVSGSFCTDCHTGLDARLTDTKINNVTAWEKHPQFRPTLVTIPSATAPRFDRISLDSVPREVSGLIYPHQLHYSRTNSVANMARTQGLPLVDGALGCNYCHVQDSDGVRFKPIEMEANCASCHDLAFARDGNVVRTLPHRKASQVAGIIRDFYIGQAVSPRADVNAVLRRTAGKDNAATLQRLSFTSVADARTRGDAAIDRVFTEKGLCADCHKIENNGAANAAERWEVAPVNLTDHYLPKGAFPHRKHLTYNGKTGDASCIECHAAPTSRRATDVLLPKVEQCRDCHGSGNAKTNVAASCDTCHGYHFGSDGPPAGSITSIKVAGHGAADWKGPGKSARTPLAASRLPAGPSAAGLGG